MSGEIKSENEFPENMTGTMLEEVDSTAVCIQSEGEDASHVNHETSVENSLNLTDSNTSNVDYRATDCDTEENMNIYSQDMHQQQNCTLDVNQLHNTENSTLCLALVQGSPLLVLTNSPNKGTFEASVMIDNQASFGNIIKVENLCNVAQANLIIQTREKIAQEYCVMSPLSSVTNTNNTLHPQKLHVSAENNMKSSISNGVYICEEPGCGHSFPSLNFLQYHHLSHNKSKAFKCKEEGCGRAFAWPAHLKYHELTHLGKRDFQCDYGDCGKSFYTAQRLAVHKRIHTGEKPFICPEEGCEKPFSTAGNLKNHMRIHSGEKPYICTIEGCGKTFAEHSSLQKHKLVHSGAKPFQCKYCGKSFSQSGSRNVHMKRHQLIASPDIDNVLMKSSVDADVLKSNNMVQIGMEENVLVLRQNEDEILQYQDLQDADSVVFSNTVADHVVTVTTQPADVNSSNLELSSVILGAEEELSQQDCITVDSTLTSSPTANVVVLSQPEEMVSMATGYHQQEDEQAETVYDSELLNIKQCLDQEEIESHISENALGI